MPDSAPLPVATIKAVGVARPIAQGHAMISTATAAANAGISDGSGPITYQTTKVAVAMEIEMACEAMISSASSRTRGSRMSALRALLMAMEVWDHRPHESGVVDQALGAVEVEQDGAEQDRAKEDSDLDSGSFVP